MFEYLKIPGIIRTEYYQAYSTSALSAPSLPYNKFVQFMNRKVFGPVLVPFQVTGCLQCLPSVSAFSVCLQYNEQNAIGNWLSKSTRKQLTNTIVHVLGAHVVLKVTGTPHLDTANFIKQFVFYRFMDQLVLFQEIVDKFGKTTWCLKQGMLINYSGCLKHLSTQGRRKIDYWGGANIHIFVFCTINFF